VERTQSLRLSHPKIDVAISLYSREDRDSLYAVTDCLQTPSELDFDFDDIVVNSAAYRRVLAAAKRPASDTNQDVSESLVEVADNVAYVQKNFEKTYVQALRDRDISDREFEALTDHLCVDTIDGESRSKAEEAQEEEERLTFEKLWEETLAEYAQIVHDLLAEKRQSIPEYTIRQSKLDRLQKEVERLTIEKAMRRGNGGVRSNVA
jgi:hypothetical protein